MLPREALRLTCAGAGTSLKRPVLWITLGAVVCARQRIAAQPHRQLCCWQGVGKPNSANLGIKHCTLQSEAHLCRCRGVPQAPSPWGRALDCRLQRVAAQLHRLPCCWQGVGKPSRATAGRKHCMLQSEAHLCRCRGVPQAPSPRGSAQGCHLRSPARSGSAAQAAAQLAVQRTAR